jgi:hypothetical protein
VALTTTNKLLAALYGSGIENVTGSKKPTLNESSTRNVNIRGSSYHVEEIAGPCGASCHRGYVKLATLKEPDK